MNQIQSDALAKFDISFAELTSICSVPDAIHFTSDCSESISGFVDNQLSEYTAKLDQILRDTGMEDKVRLIWKIHSLRTDQILELTSRKHITIQPITRDNTRDNTPFRGDSFRPFQNRLTSEDSLLGMTDPFSYLSMSSETPLVAPNNPFLLSFNTFPRQNDHDTERP